jgi:hypothetical protein
MTKKLKTIWNEDCILQQKSCYSAHATLLEEASTAYDSGSKSVPISISISASLLALEHSGPP